MAYLSDISAHSPQVLHFDRTQSRRMASRCGLSVPRAKSASILNLHPIRSDVAANEIGSPTTGSGTLGSVKSACGRLHDTPKLFAMLNLPCGNEPVKGERCQRLAHEVSASAGRGGVSRTASLPGFRHLSRHKVRRRVTPACTHSGV